MRFSSNHTCRRAILVLCAVVSAAATAVAQQAPAPGEKKTPWKPEDVVYTETAGQFRVSPDGRWAVWVKSSADKEKDSRTSNLILSSLTQKKEIELTRGSDTFSEPRWSPDGQTIAFLSTRALPKPKPDFAKMQLWLIHPDGGEAWHLTESVRGIHHFEWINSSTLLFSAEEDPSLYESELKEKKDDTRVVDDAAHTAPVRLFTLSVKDKKISRLTDNNDWIQSFDVSRDGKWAAAVASRELSYAWDQKTPPATYLVDLSTGARKQVFTDGKIRPELVKWAADNSGFYAVAPYSSSPRFFTATIQLVYFCDATSGATTQVDLAWENGLGGGFEITPDGFLALLADGVRFKPARYTRNGAQWSRKWLEGEHASNYFGLALGDDGHSLLYAYSTASTPTQWYRAQVDGSKVSSPEVLTEINPQYKNRIIARTEILHWKGANDEQVEGILFYPHDYQPGKLYPLITATHGGPAGADHDAWSESWAYSANLLNQRGAFILKTNYHGSSDYGLKWVESICCGKYYDLEIPDIEKGVDALIARGLVDPQRIGALGWSNGSILSIELLVTDPQRFKAAAVGAGDVEWISDWANVDFGESFDSYYFGKSPLEDPELYIRKSPIFKMDRVTTPTLIFFGTEDRNVPTEQGWTHYRTMYSIGKAPVRFVLFPGEPHGPQKLSHQLRKVNEEMAWFDKYLFHANPPENEALKKGSPLDVALRRGTVRKSGENFGVAFHPASTDPSAPGVLTPETVKFGGLEIGRFEITRAQYAEFDKTYKFEAGTENYPANGIPYERALAYAEWLSKMTGNTYRLPTEEEGAKLYIDRPGENTLDFWAGYSLNPEDAQRLAPTIAQISGAAPLLKQVGSFPGASDEGGELVFDLGGNVAEWVVAKAGTAKALGGSADRPADSKARDRGADPPYTGFRIVFGAPKQK
ncbi:MAG: S9 family peptidase [Candidatus Acidiferrales bacterium]